ESEDLPTRHDRSVVPSGDGFRGEARRRIGPSRPIARPSASNRHFSPARGSRRLITSVWSHRHAASRYRHPRALRRARGTVRVFRRSPGTHQRNPDARCDTRTALRPHPAAQPRPDARDQAQRRPGDGGRQQDRARGDPQRVALKTIGGLYDGATTQELDQLSIRTAAALTAEEPEYGQLAARLLGAYIDKEVSGQEIQSFSQSIARGAELGI